MAREIAGVLSGLEPREQADATTSSGASVSYSVVATDPDDGTARITVACSRGSGSIFPLGHHRA